MIELAHELSENDGLREFAEAIKQQFPHLDVKHIADPRVWSVQ